ncbi:MAG: hypothetical protein ABL933_03320 [Methyloglobulus sp.]
MNSIISHLMTDLTNDITTIINDHYTSKTIEPNPMVREEKLWLHIVLTLSRGRRYRKRLFFRHLNSKISSRGFREQIISKEKSPESPESIINYAQYVLNKRITLRLNKREKPVDAKTTSMHDLLVAYINQCADERWLGSTIKRCLDVEQNYIKDAFFRPVANILGDQIKKLDGRLGKGSSALKIKDAYGSLVLITDSSKTDVNLALVAEELSLTDAFNAIPLPLKVQSKIPYWTPDQPPIPDSTTKKLKIILQDNNRLYGLLMSCGLNPDIWLPLIEGSHDRIKDKERKQKQPIVIPKNLRPHEHSDFIKQFVEPFLEKIEYPKSHRDVTELADLMRVYNQKRRLARETGRAIESEEKLFLNCFQEVKLNRDKEAQKKKNAPKKPGKSFAGFTSPESTYEFFCLNILPNYPEIKHVFDEDEQLVGNGDQQYEPQNEPANITQAKQDKSDGKEEAAKTENGENLRIEHKNTGDFKHEQGDDREDFHPEYPSELDEYEYEYEDQELTLDDEDTKDLKKLTRELERFFDPVTAIFWELTVVEGIQAETVLNNNRFRRHIAHYPTLGYNQLSDRALLTRLSNNLTTAFRQYKREKQNAK